MLRKSSTDEGEVARKNVKGSLESRLNMINGWYCGSEGLMVCPLSNGMVVEVAMWSCGMC